MSYLLCYFPVTLDGLDYGQSALLPVAVQAGRGGESPGESGHDGADLMNWRAHSCHQRALAGNANPGPGPCLEFPLTADQRGGHRPGSGRRPEADEFFLAELVRVDRAVQEATGRQPPHARSGDQQKVIIDATGRRATRAGLLGIWLQLGVFDFRSVLAHGWHGTARRALAQCQQRQG